MSTFVSASRTHEVAPKGAIVLYGPQQGTFTYATAHAVKTDPATGRPMLDVAVPLNRRALLHALKQVAENALPKGEFLPPTILSVSQDAITWWCAPANRRVFMDCAELGRRTAVVPHPGLVFRAASNGFSVFSVLEETRPKPETALYEPPYFNTWDNGKICIGTAHVPKQIDVASVEGWEEAFFRSAFTHPNHGRQRVTYENGVYAFWRDMLDGRFLAYPKEVLVSMNCTLGQLLTGATGD
ncbi:PRTRC system protein B [Cupriavidus basilensis]|uniref:PRTRC system protein B n=1 Tax=Cupriavidus basilensis TaxID=68895 RepID=UPI0007508A60|nr:PRTRC system protein B [Cupriavidus basilensis]